MTRHLVAEIIDAVADSDDVEPTEFEPVLADYIDLDAVNQLAQHDTSTWTLTFELPEHAVTVTSEGTILVDGHPEKNWITT